MNFGPHGMIVGEINEDTKKLNLEFIEIDEKEFIEQEKNISEILDFEELIEKINAEDYDENKYYKIILTGNKKFEINTSELLKHVVHQNIVKIKDDTKIEVDLKSISNQNNLKGLFIKNLLEELENNPEQKRQIEKAIEIGIDIFKS